MSPLRAHHVGITVGNLESAIEFFTLLLQREPALTFHRVDMPFLDEITGYDDIDMRFAFFTLPGDGVQVELIEYADPSRAPSIRRRSTWAARTSASRSTTSTRSSTGWWPRRVEFRLTRPVETPPGALGGSRWLYLVFPTTTTPSSCASSRKTAEHSTLGSHDADTDPKRHADRRLRRARP